MRVLEVMQHSCCLSAATMCTPNQALGDAAHCHAATTHCRVISTDQHCSYQAMLHSHLPTPTSLPVFAVGHAQPLQTSVKPTLRPKLPCSKKNQGSVDKQAAREQQAAEGRAARYMQQAATLACHNHHHALQLGHAGATPEEHIVLGDKGKHRPAASR